MTPPVIFCAPPSPGPRTSEYSLTELFTSGLALQLTRRSTFINSTGTGFSLDSLNHRIRVSVESDEKIRILTNDDFQIKQSATTGYGFILSTVKLRSNNNVFEVDTAGVNRIRVGGATLNCVVTNQLSLGTSAILWSEVWATDGSINPSDSSLKESTVDLELGLDFVRALRKVSFVWAGRTRPHAGFVAQDVKTVLTDLGVADFAGYIDPAVGGHTPESPEDTEPPPVGWDNLALRPTEFIAPAYVAISELATRLEVLEAAALSNGDDE